MDDGYPPEKTPSKECQTCGQRQAEQEPVGHGLKDLLQGTGNQHGGREGSELGGERRSTSVSQKVFQECVQRKCICKTVQLHFTIEKPLIVVLYFAFDSVHYAHHYVVSTA